MKPGPDLFAFFEYLSRTGCMQGKDGLRRQVFKVLYARVLRVVPAQCPEEIMIGTAGGGWIADISPQGTGDVMGKNALPVKVRQHLREHLLPLRSMRGNAALSPGFSQQMSHFVNEGDEEGIRVEIVVDGNLVGESSTHWFVVAQLAGARARDLDMDVIFHDPLYTGWYGLLRNVLR